MASMTSVYNTAFVNAPTYVNQTTTIGSPKADLKPTIVVVAAPPTVALARSYLKEAVLGATAIGVAVFAAQRLRQYAASTLQLFRLACLVYLSSAVQPMVELRVI